VLPLRVFLGATFVYAGLQKLADRHFFDAEAPSSVQSQIHSYAPTSPIGGLLAAAGHHAALVGFAIAAAELAVGLGILTGLWTRAAAAGGAMLSLSFLLTVSWHARPFYYGADIVFLVAWIPLLMVGSGGVLSLDSLLHEQTRRQLAVPPAGPVSVEFATVRRLCGAYDNGVCELRRRQPCVPEPCPVLLAGSDLGPAATNVLDRRTFLRRARAAGLLAAGGAGLGSLTAIAGRLLPADSSVSHASPGAPPEQVTPPAASPGRPTGPTAGSGAPSPTVSPSRPAGTPIGPASAVAAGGAVRFVDPATGRAAYVVRGATGLRAFSAVCTHAGCTVKYGGAGGQFLCPCHGAAFDAGTGAVLRGPARRPLPPIKVTEGSDGQIYAV